MNQKQETLVTPPVMVSNHNDTLIVKTRIKAGRLAVNYNEVVR